MFGIFRPALRSFVIGVTVGVLFAPRSGVETRKMLADRATRAMNSLMELAAPPPVPPERVRTNGHPERAAAKKANTSANARASS